MKTKKLSETSEISRRHTRRLKAEGLDTPAKIAAARAVNGRIRPKGDVAANIAVEKLRYLKAQADNEEIDRDERIGNLVEVSRVLEALTKAEATKIARERAEYVVSLPARLGGQPADKIAAAYEAAMNENHAEFVKQFKSLSGI